MLLEEQLPRIQKLIKEKIGPLPANALQNEAVMQAAFRRIYQALPRMIRLAVSEQGFVEFFFNTAVIELSLCNKR